MAALLLASGACALAYEVVWLRALRLVFGTTTAATGTTLAIFLGGLGVGGLVFGRRADRVSDPLRFYAQLEFGVALGALVSLPLIEVVRYPYLAAGGVTTLGLFTATALRIVLCALVLGPPAFLMGGTLPAAVRVVAHSADRGRRTGGLLYGVNTLGAVLGTSWATFISLEQWGMRLTLLSAGIVNLIVAGLAFSMTQRRTGRAERRRETRAGRHEAVRPTAPAVEATPSTPGAPVWLVLAASGLAGAAFLAMELVWYRMLAPILGGSTYTIGLILVFALLGIALGGLLYAVGREERRPVLLGFAVTCLLEAFFLALPYALGDRIALFALYARAWAGPSLTTLVLTWTAVTGVVVLPAAIVAGYQFPLLIALLGTREHSVGREVGWAYAANTAGAIAGSLAAGFGLLPLLTAPGLWRVVVYSLLVLGALSAMLGLRGARPWRPLALALGLGILDIVLCSTEGPTAFWRHTAIGAGRVEAWTPDANGVRRLLHSRRAAIGWEAEGIESSVALGRADGYDLVINGKSDGSALGDAPTQIMSGLLAALLHPDPKRTLVIGLGTGTTAGWLGMVPAMERVDVVELEPAVLRAAEAFSPVNQDVMKNPRVRVLVGDGREFLLTTPERFDLVVSEPSNPYRAGLASFFTRDFYRSAAARLRPGGLFVQWLQAYEIDQKSVEAVYATLATVFPSVETWEVTVGGDLVLIASLERKSHNRELLAARLATEPYRSAIERTWGLSGLEGLYSSYVANADFSAAVARASGRINSEDRTFLEFEFARTVGQNTVFDIEVMRAAAARRHQDRPPISGTVDWTRLPELRGMRLLRVRGVPEGAPTDPAARARVLARQAYAVGKYGEARQHWLSQAGGAQAPIDLTVLAEIFASRADATARESIEALRSRQPAEAEALAARERYVAGDKAAAAQHLITAFGLYRRDPWAYRPVFTGALQLALRLAADEPARRRELFEALTEPFAVRALDVQRLSTRAMIGLRDGTGELCQAALVPLEPYVPWEGDLLQMRADCYARTGNPLAVRARADRDAFVKSR